MPLEARVVGSTQISVRTRRHEQQFLTGLGELVAEKSRRLANFCQSSPAMRRSVSPFRARPRRVTMAGRSARCWRRPTGRSTCRDTKVDVLVMGQVVERVRASSPCPTVTETSPPLSTGRELLVHAVDSSAMVMMSGKDAVHLGVHCGAAGLLRLLIAPKRWRPFPVGAISR